MVLGWLIGPWQEENYSTNLLWRLVYRFELVSDRLKDNKNVALVAVTHNSATLQHASERLRDDVDVVLAAAEEDLRSE